MIGASGANWPENRLEALGSVICDEKDALLLAAPYYNGFDEDFKKRPGINVIPVSIAESEQAKLSALKHFEEKIIELRKEGKSNPKVILVCNPQNPLGWSFTLLHGLLEVSIKTGFIYPDETIEGYCKLAEKYDLHL